MKTTLTNILRMGLILATVILFSGCGQKGPLILEQVPVDQTQEPLENSTDEVPVEAQSKPKDDAASSEQGDLE